MTSEASRCRYHHVESFGREIGRGGMYHFDVLARAQRTEATTRFAVYDNGRRRWAGNPRGYKTENGAIRAAQRHVENEQSRGTLGY